MNKEIYVTQPCLPPLEAYIEEVQGIWDSHILTNIGEKHKQFQAELSKYLQVKNTELFTNGHMAIELTLQSLGLKGEVITTPFTFASTTHAIVRSGLKPVFCDIKPDDFTIDSSKISDLITENTCAILPVHVYGNVCDVEEIQRIAEEYNLAVVYDAAHAFGVKHKGRGIASFGDVSCFSLHATKVFHSIEGGLACFNDNETFKERIEKMKNFGIAGPESVEYVGTNAKMNEFIAAMGLCNLRYFDKEIEDRKKVYEHYMSLLSEVDGLQLNKRTSESNYAYFPIIVDEKKFKGGRDGIYDALKEKGVRARKYFYPLTNTYECYAGMYNPEETPIALDISKRILCLPMYSSLALEDVEYICNTIINAKKA